MKGQYFILAVFIVFLLSEETFSQWIDLSNSKKIIVSDTTLIQYELSEDGKSIYAIDKNYKLFKFDNQSGNKLWNKELSKTDLGAFKFKFAKLLFSGDKYFVCGEKNDTLQISIFNTAPDTVIKKINLMRDGNYISDILIQNNNLYFYQSDNTRRSYGGGLTDYWDGLLQTYIINDSLLKNINMSYDGFNINLNLNKEGRFCLYYSEYIYFDFYKGTVNVNFYIQRLKIYNSYQNRFHTLFSKNSGYSEKMSNPPPLKSLCLSKFGNFSALQFNDSLFIYDNISCSVVSKLKISGITTSLVFSDDNKYLIRASNKNLYKCNSNYLQITDSIVIPELINKIESLAFSSDQSGIYFISGKEIYKTNSDLNSDELIASFFVEDVCIVGNNVDFVNSSSGNPLKFSWEFGDGTTSSEQNPSHIYNTPGFYDVKLKIYKNDLYSEIEIIKVINVLPKFQFKLSYEKNENQCPQLVKFKNLSLGIIDSVLWNFDNKYLSTELNPTWYSNHSGIFNVKLKVFSNRFVYDTTFDISINLNTFPLDISKFSFEKILENEKNSIILKGFECSDKSIIYNLPGSKVERIDENKNKIWSLDSINYSGILNKINFDNYYFYSLNNFVKFNTLNNIVNRVKFEKVMEYMKYIRPYFCKVFLDDVQRSIFSLNLTIFDDNFKEIDKIKMYEKTYENSYFTKIEGFDYINIDCDFNYKNNYDFIFKYNLTYSTSDASFNKTYHYDYSLYLGNKKLSSDKNINFKSFIRLNDKMCIVSYNDFTIISYDSASNEIWKIKLTKNDNLYSLLKLNDTCFIGVGSHQGILGYSIINDKGMIIDSTDIECRFGSFYHVSITPDTNLLISGYIYLDTSANKTPYFVKTNSKQIKDLLRSNLIYTSIPEITDVNFTIKPNPAIDYITISFSNSELSNKSISIFNSLGIEMKFKPSEGWQPSEGSSISFSTEDFPSGVYYCTLNTGMNRITKSFVVVR
jgi:PKD repeat protein